MARATYAEVKKLNGGVDFNATWGETAVGNVCTQADAWINGMAHPATFGTGTNETFFANMLVYRFIDASIEAEADGVSVSFDDVWDDFMERWFRRLLTTSTYKSVTTVKAQDTS